LQGEQRHGRRSVLARTGRPSRADDLRDDPDELPQSQPVERDESQQETLDTTSSLPVVITDTACSSEPAPDDAFAANIKHPQETKQAHLELPFQPFGKGQLCIKVPVAGKPNLSKHWVFNYSLANANGATLNVYEAEVASKKIERKEEVTNETEPKEKPVVEEVIEELETSLATCK